MVNSRWTRMSKLVDIDLESLKVQLQSYEQELAAAQEQFESLSDYADQSEADINRPTDYSSVQSLSRQKLFLDSLRHAMDQQNQSILGQQQHLEGIRGQLLALYQKRESYVILAAQEEQEDQMLRDKKEADFLDDLSSKPYDSDGL